MLLTVTTTREPATDLWYLLHKHPDRLQTFVTAARQAHVFYPEAAPGRCTAAALLEVDPVALVREHDFAPAPDTLLVDQVREAAEAAGLFDEFGTPWLLFGLPRAAAPVAPRPGRPARRGPPRIDHLHPPGVRRDRRPGLGGRGHRWWEELTGPGGRAWWSGPPRT